MAESKGADEIWLPVIGRALAYWCLSHADQAKPFPDILAKVKFLTDMGLPEADAAYAAGSNPSPCGSRNPSARAVPVKRGAED